MDDWRYTNIKYEDNDAYLCDDYNYLVSYKDDDGKYNSPYRAYWCEFNKKFFALDTMVTFPLYVDIYMQIPKLPNHINNLDQYQSKFLGTEIKLIRKKLKISQENLANHLSINRSRLSLIENNKIKLRVEELLILSNVFNISIDQLTGNK